jgi:hypothetical protein
VLNSKAYASQLPRRFICWGMVFFFTALYCLLAVQKDLSLAIPMLVGITALLTGLLCLIFYLGEKDVINLSPWIILAVAAFLRLIFVFREPQLSDDIFRYLWDGLQLLTGQNPYTLAPESVSIHSKAFALLLKKINHPQLVTIYPPAAQLAFAAGSAIGGQMLGVKALFAAMDLATCAILLRLLSLVKLPSWRAVLYAWHPLPILEIAASGHVDGVCILFLFLTFLLLAQGAVSTDWTRTLEKASCKIILNISAGLAFSFSALIKLFPLIFLPGCLLFGRSRNNGAFLLGIIFCTILLIIPFMPDLQNAFGPLTLYIQHWEFSGFPFRMLRDISGSGDISRLILSFSLLFVLLIIFFKQYLKRHTSRGLNATETNASILQLLKDCYCVSMAYLFFTPTLHPWYALYLVSFLPFAAGPTGLSFSWSVFLAYQVLIPYKILGKWAENDSIPLMIFIAPSIAFVSAQLFRRIRIGKDQGVLPII